MNMHVSAGNKAQFQDRARALFTRIEAVLENARSSDMFAVDALRNVRAMMHGEFADLEIVGSFTINDWEDFRDWSVTVSNAQDFCTRLTHQS